MDKNLKNILIVFGIIFVVGTLFVTGICVGRLFWNNSHSYSNMMGFGSGFGIMRNNRTIANNENSFFEQGMMGQGVGYGMMDNYSFSNDNPPLTINEARELFESYISSQSNEKLEIKEIMIFDNNAYAIIVEQDTGIGAFELLINPTTKEVLLEQGPNMMWNEKYGMMKSNRYSNDDYQELFASMTISQNNAEEIAQTYLDEKFPGSVVSHDITAFYGYYTMDIELDDVVTGMLSVNGFNGDVFYHSWHGEFIEMVH